jgi:hypothetical protein
MRKVVIFCMVLRGRTASPGPDIGAEESESMTQRPGVIVAHGIGAAVERP